MTLICRFSAYSTSMKHGMGRAVQGTLPGLDVNTKYHVGGHMHRDNSLPVHTLRHEQRPEKVYKPLLRAGYPHLQPKALSTIKSKPLISPKPQPCICLYTLPLRSWSRPSAQLSSTGTAPTPS